ncbi:hypothetical protein [Kitasatospora cinereorecta]|uniref:Uncharacterized protein n=1 Tax=Kitasatospora cinereorecta TaxID=285560 RepID=A0ABW0VRN8_9ACTN
MTALDQTPSDGSAAPQPLEAGTGTGAVRPRRLRRPTPSRRLSRVHGQPGQRGPGAAGAATTSPAEPVAGTPDATDAMDATGDAGGSAVPMGVLIGGSVGRPGPAGPGGGGAARRVAVELVRAGRGTTQLVLPEWRSAIAISVPTEQLLASTGLRLDALGAARLTVLINPDALHDRELDLREWQSEPEPDEAQSGRRRGRGRARPPARRTGAEQ